MKLKQLRNDGIWEKKGYEDGLADDPYYTGIEVDSYNQAKAELSEVEVRVDEEKLFKTMKQCVSYYLDKGADTETCIKKQVEALSSSMGEWLELRKGE